MKNIIKKLALGVLLGLSMSLISCSMDEEDAVVTPTPPKETRTECLKYKYERRMTYASIGGGKYEWQPVTDWKLIYAISSPGPASPRTVYLDENQSREIALETICTTVEVN